MKIAPWLTLALLGVACSAARLMLRADEPEPEYKTEFREQRYQIKKPLRKEDGSTEEVTEEVINVVPVTVRTGTASATRPAVAVSHSALTAPAYVTLAAGEDSLDEESQKLFESEKAAAAEARKLTGQLPKTKSESQRVELRTQLREKLAAVFDLQQKRRAHEIGKIEERLTKLKETMKKRDAAKDSIVDRRLELVTGGTDELGWEETAAWPAVGTTVPYPRAVYPNPINVPPGGWPQLAPSTTPIPPAPTVRPKAASSKGASVPGSTVVPPATGSFPTPPVIPSAPVAPIEPVAPAAPAAPAAPSATPPAAAPAAPAAPAPPAAPPSTL